MDYGVDAIMFSDGHLGDAAPAVTYPVPVLPFMRSSGERPGVPAVDDAGGGVQAARHLLDLGTEPRTPGVPRTQRGA